MRPWNSRWNTVTWERYLAAGETESDRIAIRQSTHSGRPLGAPTFIESLERLTHRHLTPRPGGRPTKPVARDAEEELPLSR